MDSANSNHHAFAHNVEVLTGEILPDTTKQELEEFSRNNCELLKLGFSPWFIDAYFRFTSFVSVMQYYWNNQEMNEEHCIFSAGSMAEQAISVYAAMNENRRQLSLSLATKTTVSLIDEIDARFRCLPSGWNGLSAIKHAYTNYNNRADYIRLKREEESEQQKGNQK